MTTERILLVITIMASITYICRMLPIVFIRRKIKNKYFRSFLIYLPYGVMAAMVFPKIFFSTASIMAYAMGILGAIVAFILAYKKRGLLVVALSSILTVALAEWIISLI